MGYILQYSNKKAVVAMRQLLWQFGQGCASVLFIRTQRSHVLWRSFQKNETFSCSFAISQLLWQFGRCDGNKTAGVAIWELFYSNKTDAVAIWETCSRNKTAVVAIWEMLWP